MTRPVFRDLVEARWDMGRFLCVGLDPDWERLPRHLKAGDGAEARAESVLDFCSAIVEATHDLACAFKPNAAFFEALGAAGAAVLARLMARVREIGPDIPVIYDAKRGDIGSTNEGYVRHAFDDLGADAVTVQPYFGGAALAPFLARRDKGVFVLCRTSNPGGGEFQDLAVGAGPERLYEAVARTVAAGWNGNDNCGLVVGATVPGELARVRALAGDMPLLIPGIGAQGGDLRATVAAGRDARGRGMIIAASRAILYASSGEDFASAARAETRRLGDAVNAYR